MAMHTINPWIPEEWDGPVIQKVLQMSAIEAAGRPEPMSTATRHVPRSGGMGMDILGNGDQYTEDSSSDDAVLLVARKFGRAISLAEEDLQDSQNLVNILDVKRVDWATAYAKSFDNACIGTIGALSVAADRPFTSCYQAVRTTDSSISYTADTNYLLAGVNLGAVTITQSTATVTFAQLHGLFVNDQVVLQGVATVTGITNGTPYFVVSVPSTTTITISATLGGAALTLGGSNGTATSCSKSSTTYGNLSAVAAIYEQSDWFDPSASVVIAAPKFKQRFRDVKDNVGRPIFIEGTAGTPDTLFNYPVHWSLGARTSTAATPAPTGNPLLVIGNRNLLIVGKRSGPESYVADASTGVGFSTDETKLKVRARRAFALGHTTGIAVLEDAGL